MSTYLPRINNRTRKKHRDQLLVSTGEIINAEPAVSFRGKHSGNPEVVAFIKQNICSTSVDIRKQLIENGVVDNISASTVSKIKKQIQNE